MSFAAPCPCCASRSSPVAFHDTAYLRCPACGALRSTVPAASYEEDYYYHSAAFEAAERRRGKILWRYFERAIGVIPTQRPDLRAARVLELGCSRGYFVEECLRRGVDVSGMDVSAHAIEAAQARGLRACIHGDARKAPPGDLRDVVVAWELLEHFDDPQELLHAVQRHLRAGGWFLGSTPNGGSSWLKLLGSGWHGCGIPQYHRIYYNPDALRSAFRLYGFDRVGVVTCSEWRDSLLIKNAATVLTRRYIGTNALPVRALVAAAIGLPEKLAEMASGHTRWIRGDTLLFAARRAA